MRFKIDDNLPIEVAVILNDAGHDAMTINDQGMTGTLDPNVAAVCQAENAEALDKKLWILQENGLRIRE